MYAIVQDIDGHTTVVGNSHRIYDDVDEATLAWEEIAFVWYEQFAGLPEAQRSFSWTENPPKLLDLSTKTTLYPSGDKRDSFLKMYVQHQAMQEGIQLESIDKSKSLKAGYKANAKALLRRS